MPSKRMCNRRTLMAVAGSAAVPVVASGTALAQYDDRERGGGQDEPRFNVNFGGCSRVIVTGDLSQATELFVGVETWTDGRYASHTLAYSDLEGPVFNRDMADELSGDPDRLVVSSATVQAIPGPVVSESNPHADRCRP